MSKYTNVFYALKNLRGVIHQLQLTIFGKAKIGKPGAAGEIRTPGLSLTKGVLYP